MSEPRQPKTLKETFDILFEFFILAAILVLTGLGVW
jgi:hypothetical protein